MNKKKDLHSKRVVLVNPSLEQDDEYSELFEKGQIEELVFQFDYPLKIGERGFFGDGLSKKEYAKMIKEYEEGVLNEN